MHEKFTNLFVFFRLNINQSNCRKNCWFVLNFTEQAQTITDTKDIIVTICRLHIACRVTPIQSRFNQPFIELVKKTEASQNSILKYQIEKKKRPLLPKKYVKNLIRWMLCTVPSGLISKKNNTIILWVP